MTHAGTCGKTNQCREIAPARWHQHPQNPRSQCLKPDPVLATTSSSKANLLYCTSRHANYPASLYLKLSGMNYMNTWVLPRFVRALTSAHYQATRLLQRSESRQWGIKRASPSYHWHSLRLDCYSAGAYALVEPIAPDFEVSPVTSNVYCSHLGWCWNVFTAKRGWSYRLAPREIIQYRKLLRPDYQENLQYLEW